MKRTILTLTAAALATMGLAACGAEDDAGSDKSAEKETTAAPATEEQDEKQDEKQEEDETTSEDTNEDDIDVDDVSTGGSYTATLDGEEFTVDEGMIVCTDTGGVMNIAVGPTNPNAEAKAIAAVIEGDQVTALTMGSAQGQAITYAAEAGQGSATVETDGNTYTINGEGLFADVANPGMPELKPFELQVTCD